jgi:Fanconi anemia group M protein
MGITNPLAEPLSPEPPTLWNTDKVELREYQQKIFERAKNDHLMVVIPTGLGKTYIAARLGAYFLEKTTLKQKIVFLAPTRPLLTQHWTSHQTAVNLPATSFQIISGKTPPKKRTLIFTAPETHFMFMTPQTLRNDLKNGLYTLKDVALIVFDEAHRAMGEYAYVPIARFFHEQQREGRILALTASPGANQEKVQEILTNLHIPLSNLVYRDKHDTDVKAYTHEVETSYIGVEMTEIMQKIHGVLQTIKWETTFQYIQLYTRFDPSVPTNEKKYTQGFCVSQIKKLTGQLKTDVANGRQIRILISTNARLMKLHHFLKNLEAQGLQILLKNLQTTLKKITEGKASKADEFLFRDPRLSNLLSLIQELQVSSPSRLLHPKMVRLKEIVRAELYRHPASRILVFTKLRITVGILVKFLKDEVVKPKKFVGQASKSKTDKGLKQKEQVEILEKFRHGVFNVLCATNVAEEGLDIAECNLVIFYDNSASEIRLIQRMGRTGRSGKGKVVFLYTKGTSDEVALWTGKRKRAQMRTKLGGVPLKPNPRKILSSPNRIRQSTLLPQKIVSPTSLEEPEPKLKLKNVQIHISPPKQTAYQLSNALPIAISPTQISHTGYDLAIPAVDPFIGIDIVPAAYIPMKVTNLSLYRQSARKKQSVPHYLIFVDACTLLPSSLETLQKSIITFKKFTGITVTVFQNQSILHLILRRIFSTYLKNNPH